MGWMKVALGWMCARKKVTNGGTDPRVGVHRHGHRLMPGQVGQRDHATAPGGT
jgi:hypothetical protein